MDRSAVSAWVAGYEQAWRDADVDAVPRLFTERAHYRRSPYEPADVGHAAIQAFWAEDEGSAFTVDHEVLAVQDGVAVVRLQVRYLRPTEQEYRDLWVLRFAADGRVEDFEEWPYWPGRAYTAASS